MIGRAAVHSFMICDVSAAVNGRFLSMKIICGWSSRPPVRRSTMATTRLAASSAPRSATEFATSRGMSTSQRRMHSRPSSVSRS
jgi:hypothetical protein